MASLLTSEQRAAFERDGYILVRGFFDKEEAHLRQTAVDQDPAIRGHFYDRGDAEGMTTKMATWNHTGDVPFFHCDTLHRSDANRSDDRRWTLICCHNAARNDPYLDHRQPRYTPIEKVADEQIKAAGLKFADPADEDALDGLNSSAAFRR